MSKPEIKNVDSSTNTINSGSIRTTIKPTTASDNTSKTKTLNVKHKLYMHDIDERMLSQLLKSKFLYIDTEAMGLNILHNRLCLVQILGDSENNDESVALIKIDLNIQPCPNLTRLLINENICKVFHFARFDIAMIQHYLNIRMKNIICTRTLSKMCRTFTDKHGLQSLCRDMLSVHLEKGAQSSDWGRSELTRQQLSYAANDVIYLRAIHQVICEIAIRENKWSLAQKAFESILTCVDFDLANISLPDMLNH